MDMERQIHDECGVFGIYGVEHAASLTYYGLHALQHRGQEGCGIVSVDAQGEFHRIKGKGLVTEVFKGEELQAMQGGMAIGHVLYTAAEGNRLENVQPLFFRHRSGDFVIANNGSLVNAEELRNYLEKRGSLFQSSSDSEILAHLIKKDNVGNRPRITAILDALNMMEGAFTFLVMTSRRIYACRDKHGLHPLAIGRLGEGYVVASETCA
ncbi:MAG: amidophosphoribosyltransferase, partial [Alistipes sp.]|nr:amidophosphoribosyltransferase [Alistipes sp.]